MPPAAPPVFILGNTPGTIFLRVFGTNRILRAWIDGRKNVWAQMPLPSKLQVDTVGKFQIVELEGITQVVAALPRSNNTPEELKRIGFSILKRLKLITPVPATGVMFVSRKDKNIKIDPVVWVRDVKTLFYETACASGTTAVAVLEFLKEGKGRARFSVIQPSGKKLLAQVEKSNLNIQVAIGGKVKIL